MKSLLFSIFLMLMISAGMAQTKYGISGSLVGATGQLSDDYNGGLGFDLLVRQKVGETLDIGLGAGLYTFYGFDWDKKVLPLYASVDIYLYRTTLGPADLKVFAGGNGGIFISWYKNEYAEASGNLGLSIAPKTGVTFDFHSFELFTALQYNGSLPRKNAFLGLHTGVLF